MHTFDSHVLINLNYHKVFAAAEFDLLALCSSLCGGMGVDLFFKFLFYNLVCYYYYWGVDIGNL